MLTACGRRGKSTGDKVERKPIIIGSSKRKRNRQYGQAITELHGGLRAEVAQRQRARRWPFQLQLQRGPDLVQPLRIRPAQRRQVALKLYGEVAMALVFRVAVLAFV